MSDTTTRYIDIILKENEMLKEVNKTLNSSYTNLREDFDALTVEHSKLKGEYKVQKDELDGIKEHMDECIVEMKQAVENANQHMIATKARVQGLFDRYNQRS